MDPRDSCDMLSALCRTTSIVIRTTACHVRGLNRPHSFPKYRFDWGRSRRNFVSFREIFLSLSVLVQYVRLSGGGERPVENPRTRKALPDVIRSFLAAGCSVQRQPLPPFFPSQYSGTKGRTTTARDARKGRLSGLSRRRRVPRVRP